jgi:hypothetical protein
MCGQWGMGWPTVSRQSCRDFFGTSSEVPSGVRHNRGNRAMPTVAVLPERCEPQQNGRWVVRRSSLHPAPPSATQPLALPPRSLGHRAIGLAGRPAAGGGVADRPCLRRGNPTPRSQPRRCFTAAAARPTHCFTAEDRRGGRRDARVRARPAHGPSARCPPAIGGRSSGMRVPSSRSQIRKIDA